MEFEPSRVLVEYYRQFLHRTVGFVGKIPSFFPTPSSTAYSTFDYRFYTSNLSIILSPQSLSLSNLRRLRLFSTMASYEDLFRYTSGRWLNDEQRQQALRYQRFNIDALKSVAASSARASGVTDIRKLAEGRCNKVFHIQLTEGAQVIAQIPTPLSGRPHLVTANEVATMEFLRNRLGLTQVPRVLSWSSRSEDTPVGAEYIIMDVADGVELHSVWHQLSM
jgi:hypothetical protein